MNKTNYIIYRDRARAFRPATRGQNLPHPDQTRAKQAVSRLFQFGKLIEERVKVP